MIKNASISNINDLVIISKKCFGNNYLTHSYFKSSIESETSYCWVKIIEKNIVAFLIVETMDNQKLSTTFYDYTHWLLSYIENKGIENNLLIKQIAVLPQFQNKKIASELLLHLFQTSLVNTDALWCVCWDKKEKNYFITLLEKLQFKHIKTAIDFWKKDSLIKNYTCTDCQQQPCKCSASIYFLLASNKMAFSSLLRLS